MPQTPSGATAGTASARPDASRTTPTSTDDAASRPSGFAPQASSTVASTDIGAGAPYATNPRTSAMNRPEKLDQKIDDTLDNTARDAASVKDKAAAELSGLSDGAKKARDDAAAVGEDLATLARDAVSALQRVADDLATRAGNRAGEAVDVAKSVGVATVDNVAAVANDARHRAENGVEALSQSVSRNPLTAVAIAAGVGMVFGMMNRSDRR